MTVKTNNVPRDILYGSDLPESVLSDFDYLDDIEQSTFFKYKNQYYDTGEFMYIDQSRECLPEDFKGWAGYQSDSFFSGTLIKFVDDNERVVVAQYCD